MKKSGKRLSWPVRALLIGLGVLLLIPLYIFMFNPVFTSAVIAPGIANQLLEAGVAADYDKMLSLIRPENRAKYGHDKLKTELVDRLVGYDRFDLRKGYYGSSFTNRGEFRGYDTADVSGYVKYKGTDRDRSFSVSIVNIGGKWYITSFSMSSTLA